MKNIKRSLKSTGRYVARTLVGVVVISGAAVAVLIALAALGWLSVPLGGPAPDDMLPYRFRGEAGTVAQIAEQAYAGAFVFFYLVMMALIAACVIGAAYIAGRNMLRGLSAKSGVADEANRDDELRHALLLADDVAPLPAPAHAALVTLRARLAAAHGVSVEQLVAKAVQP